MEDDSTSPIGVPLAPYLAMFHSFLDRHTTALDFEGAFLVQFKNDSTPWTPDEFAVLNALFLDVDEYVDDDDLRRAVGGLDELQLRAAVETALQNLEGR